MRFDAHMYRDWLSDFIDFSGGGDALEVGSRLKVEEEGFSWELDGCVGGVGPWEMSSVNQLVDNC